MARPPVRIAPGPTPAQSAPAPDLRLADIVDPGRNGFGMLRLAMALAVLVSHSYWFTTGRTAAEPLHALTGHSLGEHAVQVFFFLSGIMVAQSLLKSRSLIDYACARALRIFPALIVCVALTALLLGPAMSSLGLEAYLGGGTVAAYIVKTLSLSTGSATLPGVFAGLPLPHLVNMSLWTLKFEVLCYVALAGFGLAWQHFERLRPLLVAGLALFVAGIFIAEPKPIESYGTIDNVRYFALFFFAGTLAFLVRRHLVLSWLALPPLLALFVVTIGTRWGELSSALFLGYATLMIASIPLGAIGRFIDQHDYSYGVYIYACPIQQALIQLFPDIGAVEVTLVALALVAGLAMLSFELVERPAMSQRKRVVEWVRRLYAGRAKVAVPVEVEATFAVHAPVRSRVALATRRPIQLRRPRRAA